MISHPSPNYDQRFADDKVKYLILHYTGMATGEEALARLCDPKAKVSAHYMIEEDGRIFSLVPENMRAWHAGVSSWEGNRDINGLSIGIELVNPGHDGVGPDGKIYMGNYRPFPMAQMTALIELCQDILQRHDIKPWHILGHSDVAPERKSDPGELFDWRGLAAQGIGLWPAQKNTDTISDVVTLQQKLKLYGYGIDITGAFDSQTENILTAFQRHYRPTDFRGKIDAESCAILNYLLTLKGTA